MFSLINKYAPNNVKNDFLSDLTVALALVPETVAFALVIEHGVQYLFASVVLMEFLKIAFGLFKLGKFIRLVPHPVFLGFVNSLAMVIIFNLDTKTSG